MPRVVHFEIHADQPERAIAFYEKLFGWQFAQFGSQDYWLITTGQAPEPGIDGGLAKREGGATGDRIVAYVGVISVDDIDATIDALADLGAPVVDGKREVPGVGWSAYFKDPEDNVFGIFQNYPPAPATA